MSTIIERQFKSKKRNIKVMIEKYNSAMEVAEDCRRRTITDSSFNDKSMETFDSWEGVKSYDEALNLLTNGYQPTVEKLKKALKGTVTGSGKRITFKNDIAGFAPVVPLALQGVPNSMIGMTMKPIKCKVIDIYYDITCSAGTSSEQIIKNGQKILGAVLDLESQGYKFNIYAIQGYSDERSVDMLAVKVKSSTQPLDLKRISFPMTHTAFFRVIGFDWYSRTPKAKYRSGYGKALGYILSQEELDAFAKQTFGENAVYIAGKNIINREEDYIREVLTDAGNKKQKR